MSYNLPINLNNKEISLTTQESFIKTAYNLAIIMIQDGQNDINRVMSQAAKQSCLHQKR